MLDASLKRVRVQSALAAANEFAGLFTFLALAAGGYFAMVGWATFGVMIALIQLSNNIQYFAYTIGGTVSRIQAALAATDRILALMDTPPEPDTYPACREPVDLPGCAPIERLGRRIGAAHPGRFRAPRPSSSGT